MKKLILLFLFLNTSVSLFSQDSTRIDNWSMQSEYLRRSHQQKKVGTIISVTGAGLMGVGIVFLIGEVAEEVATTIGSIFSPYPQEEKNHPSIGSIIFTTGTALLIAGTPFLISSKINKKKAASFSLTSQPITILRGNYLITSVIPSVSLKFCIGK